MISESDSINKSIIKESIGEKLSNLKDIIVNFFRMIITKIKEFFQKIFQRIKDFFREMKSKKLLRRRLSEGVEYVTESDEEYITKKDFQQACSFFYHTGNFGKISNKWKDYEHITFGKFTTENMFQKFYQSVQSFTQQVFSRNNQLINTLTIFYSSNTKGSSGKINWEEDKGHLDDTNDIRRNGTSYQQGIQAALYLNKRDILIDFRKEMLRTSNESTSTVTVDEIVKRYTTNLDEWERVEIVDSYYGLGNFSTVLWEKADQGDQWLKHIARLKDYIIKELESTKSMIISRLQNRFKDDFNESHPVVKGIVEYNTCIINNFTKAVQSSVRIESYWSNKACDIINRIIYKYDQLKNIDVDKKKVMPQRFKWEFPEYYNED